MLVYQLSFAFQYTHAQENGISLKLSVSAFVNQWPLKMSFGFWFRPLLDFLIQ